MSRRLVILTEIIAPYRIPVFNRLARTPSLDLHVIFLAETDETMRQWTIYKEEIRFSYQVLPSWRKRLGKATVLINRGLRAALAAAKPDVIICGGYNYAASWDALRWAKKNSIPFLLWSESNRQDARSRFSTIERLKASFVKRCDGFVVPGKSASEYLKSLGAPARKIHVAPNAVDNESFAANVAKARLHADALRAKLGLPQRYLLFTGRLVPEKGVFDLLHAYAKLESDLRSAVGLVLVGDGVSRKKLMQMAKQISPGTVFLPGFAQRDDLAQFYALAEAFVLPTHSDPWGLVVNEAMACGLPIIVTSVAGCSADLVVDGWNGYAIPTQDVEKMATAISSLLQNAKRTQTMGQRSLEMIRNYSPEACAAWLAEAALRTAESR